METKGEVRGLLGAVEPDVGGDLEILAFGDSSVHAQFENVLVVVAVLIAAAVEVVGEKEGVVVQLIVGSRADAPLKVLAVGVALADRIASRARGMRDEAEDAS